MKTVKTKYHVNSYSDQYFKAFFCDDLNCTCISPEHVLILVYSGKLTVTKGEMTTSVNSGEYIFIQRGTEPLILKQYDKDEKFHSIVIGFNRSFLTEFYRKLNKNAPLLDDKILTGHIVKLPQTPYMKSLYVSLLPYFEWESKPSNNILQLKLKEAAYCLLMTDENFCSCLFDFKTTEKKDILGFLNNHYRYDLTVAQIAAFTGRSASTFRRHFREISELPPHQWIFHKRLEEARLRLQEGENEEDVYPEVGFKNLNQFKTAFKKKYGAYPEFFNEHL